MLTRFVAVAQDEEMHDLELREYANCRNAAVLTDLGQVEIVLSDKTGTLTQNKMTAMKFLAPAPSAAEHPDTPYMFGKGMTSLKKVIEQMEGRIVPADHVKPPTDFKADGGMEDRWAMPRASVSVSRSLSVYLSRLAVSPSLCRSEHATVAVTLTAAAPV